MDLPTPPYSAEPLPQELQTLLERHGQPRVVAKGAVVVAEGDPSHAMYLVRDGRLTVFVTDDEGHEVLLNQLGPGEYFGELMLGSPVRTASVRALERSRLVMLPRAVVEAAIHEQPELALHLIRRLVQRIQALSRELGDGILISEATRMALGAAPELGIVDHGIRHVKGKQQGVRIYAVYCWENSHVA